MNSIRFYAYEPGQLVGGKVRQGEKTKQFNFKVETQSEADRVLDYFTDKGCKIIAAWWHVHDEEIHEKQIYQHRIDLVKFHNDRPKREQRLEDTLKPSFADIQTRVKEFMLKSSC